MVPLVEIRLAHIQRWITEKLDGIRGFWDGERLFSKQGNEMSVPQSFTEGLPNFPLDGELWAGRGSLEKFNILRMSRSIDWKEVKFIVFDTPSDRPYESRIESLQNFSFPNHVRVIRVQLCKGIDHLKEELNSVVSDGGEGIIMRHPTLGYIPGRSNSVLKVKVGNDLKLHLLCETFQDSEVRVIEARDAGRMILCEQ